ncbi:malic enzyme [Reticulomyxa filosa]|uniref:Malic enzyme n=1 Tax=Reticulomyxa filosa TaxID=46433 RepID=X6MCI6_RETFI|nr:malic enzyme [Reticulomyxa filosa]|eukprot:ETO10750.1 malic enzyme [Reticulomyxa filosa]
MKNNNRKIIFPMSNLTSQAEQAFLWTENKCIFASGSTFPKLTIDDKEIVPSQGNNAYIFPGVALGIIASKSSRVTDGMFLLAAQVLFCFVFYVLTLQSLDVIKGYAKEMDPEDLRDLVARCRYDHKHQRFYHDSCFDSLVREFGQDIANKTE